MVTMIGLIPHLYDIPWSRDLNRALLGVPGVRKIADWTAHPYMASRKHQALWMAANLDRIRAKEYKALFFANLLEDFHPAYMRATGVSKIFGFVHGTHWLLGEPGKGTEKMQMYERAVLELADEVFVSTKWFADRIPSEVTVIGLPLLGKIGPPRTSDPILFNHRLSKAKGAHLLSALPAHLRERLIVTTPKVNPAMFSELRKWNIEPRVLERSAYKEVAASCGYGLSLSTYDTFGYSVLDGFQDGLAYFVMDTERTACRETVIDEFRFETFGELSDKIAAMDDDPAFRARMVEKQQEHQSPWMYDAWRTRMGDHFRRT